MIEGQQGVTWEDWVALAEACERLGFETLFRSDHYGPLESPATGGSLDAWSTVCGLAAVTRTVRLGTLVSPATFRHPSVLAKSAVTADHISGGRVEVGLGAGWNEREHHAYGFDFPVLRVRVEVFAEQLELVHRQWTEDEVDFSGRHYRVEKLRALPRPVQSPRPRLIVGGSARPATVQAAVRYADEYNTIYVPVDEVARRRGVLDESCARHGRDPTTLALSLMTGCIVGRDEGEVLQRTRAVMERSEETGAAEKWLETLQE